MLCLSAALASTLAFRLLRRVRIQRSDALESGAILSYLPLDTTEPRDVVDPLRARRKTGLLNLVGL